MTKNQPTPENILIFNNIRSAQNVGAMFRTADAVGISKIYLVGYTPAPIDRFGKKRSDLEKSALGAEEMVPWEIKKSLSAIIRRLRREGFLIIAIEQSENSIDYKKVKTKNKTAFVVGNEVIGLPKNLLNECDIVAEIKMSGKKESLNVSVALGVALFRILNL
ncbi:MAG: TrmH family RNA methyltransferase [Candidatus Paceibacterota bacterium]|jgi:tRNA G18 (ribose-2'-O)-methylase SpoU